MFRHLMADVLMRVAYDLKTDNLGKWAAGGLDTIAVAINDWSKRSMAVSGARSSCFEKALIGSQIRFLPKPVQWIL